MKTESKRLYFAGLIAIALLVISLITVVLLWQHERMKAKEFEYTLRAYRVVNGTSASRMDMKGELKKIVKYSKKGKVPSNLIRAIYVFENGMPLHEYGVTKIFTDIKYKYPVDLWQLLGCIKIIREEMDYYLVKHQQEPLTEKEIKEFVYKHRKDFVSDLADRYCPDNKAEWGKTVLRLWKKFDKEGK